MSWLGRLPPKLQQVIPIGKRHEELVKIWAGTGAVFYAAAGITFCWMCDWKLVMDKIPWYGRKYDFGTPK